MGPTRASVDIRLDSCGDTILDEVEARSPGLGRSTASSTRKQHALAAHVGAKLHVV